MCYTGDLVVCARPENRLEVIGGGGGSRILLADADDKQKVSTMSGH